MESIYSKLVANIIKTLSYIEKKCTSPAESVGTWQRAGRVRNLSNVMDKLWSKNIIYGFIKTIYALRTSNDVFTMYK